MKLDNLRIGTRISLHADTDVDAKFAQLAEIGFNCCQLVCYVPGYTDENLEKIKAASVKHGIEVTAIWAYWEGICRWTFYEGQHTIGIVPPKYRAMRVQQIKQGADFAYKLGVTDVVTHCGYIPENPYDENYLGVIAAIREICEYIKPRGQYFLFETGQETPVTLLRAIEDVGTGNLGINLDTANLIMYGKANTLDSLDVFGQYVRNTHCKDGLYPTSGRALGKEVALGEGKAQFPAVVKKLLEIGYNGPFVIEREIQGEQQQIDIIKARDLIRKSVEEA